MRISIPILATLVAAGPLSGLQSTPELRQGVDEVFAEYNRTNGPGCAVGVVQDGHLSFTSGYGIGQLDHSIPLSGTSVFYLASVSKQFAAAAIVIAEFEGFLSLDDELSKHIPEFPDYGPTLTIRNLLHHTSGVRDYLTLMYLAGIPYENILSDETMLGLITRQHELNFDPGSEYLYSNSGYVLLAEIVERSTGRSLREYAEEKIFRPLGMTNTHFHDNRTHVIPKRVFSYDAGSDGSWNTNYLMNFDKVGDGGLYSSVEDLARWDSAFYEDVLGVPDFAGRMYTQGVLSTGDTIAYARGLAVGERRGHQRVSHGGGLMAFRTMITRYPELRTSVITLCNVGTANSAGLSVAVEDLVLGDRFSEPAEEPTPPARGEADEEAEVVVSASAISMLAGSYASTELGATWVLEAEDSNLILHHPNGSTLALEARSATRFVWPGRGLELEFHLEGGRVTSFVLGAGRVRNIRFQKSG